MGEDALVELAEAAAATVGRERLAAEVSLMWAGAHDGPGAGLGEQGRRWQGEVGGG